MNPYDFVPLDLEHLPEWRKPIWHAMLTQQNGQKLYSGYITLYMKAETPLFIPEAIPPERNPDPGALKTHICDKNGSYIIPGSSLKGMLRTVVETLCRGCLAVFYQPEKNPQRYPKYPTHACPIPFQACTNATKLCIACRLFGMMGRGNANMFLGKVNIGDALAYEDTPDFYGDIYTGVLDEPKPRHHAFYLNERQQIAGRKFYFHHADEPHTEDRLIEIRNRPDNTHGQYRNQQRSRYRNQYIQPLDYGTEFFGYIHFTQLTTEEFAALLLAVSLPSDMRHKIGYGKPLGLGSIQLVPTGLQLVDYALRYSKFHAGRGITTYDFDQTTALYNEQWASLDPQISATIQRFSSYPSMKKLKTIWQWEPDNSIVYRYPGQNWFQGNSTAPLSATRYLR